MNTGADQKATTAPATAEPAAKKPAAETQKTAPPPATEKRRQTPRKAEFIVPACIILLIAVVFIYLNQGLLRLAKDIAGGKADSAATFGRIEARLDAARADENRIRASLEALQAEQAALDARLADAAAAPQGGAHSDYALAEIEYLLVLAGHKLTLEQDVAGALAALRAADQRLTGLALPGAEQAQARLRADMARLGALEQADLGGLGLYLSDLIQRVDALPLGASATFEPAAAPAGAAPEGARGFFAAVWRELKSLVIVRREDEAERPRLLPDQVYFLRANIKLELANARLAVFNRDTDNLHASLRQIQDWLGEHFDMDDSATANFNDTLRRMQGLELALPALTIDSTLESVRALAGPKPHDAGGEP